MTDSNRYSGAITIVPPLTAAQIRDLDSALKLTDIALRISEQIEETDSGEVVTRTADAIEPTCDGLSGRHLVEELAALVGRFRRDHTNAATSRSSTRPGPIRRRGSGSSCATARS